MGFGDTKHFSKLATIKSNIHMAKQMGYVKAVGTVDDNVNFYYNLVDGFLVRLLPGVDSKRFWTEPAFEGSRRSAERFATGNIMSSIIYRFVPVKRRYRHLFKQVRTIAIVCLKQGIDKGDVFTALYNFLEEQKRISLTQEQFNLLLSSFLEELDQTLKEPKPEMEKKQKNKLDIKVEAPLQEDDLEHLLHYMNDYDWKVRFEGDFPPDCQVPFFLLKHVA
jgi:hypothetical protein